jgi:hypothetical protein
MSRLGWAGDARKRVEVGEDGGEHLADAGARLLGDGEPGGEVVRDIDAEAVDLAQVRVEPGDEPEPAKREERPARERQVQLDLVAAGRRCQPSTCGAHPLLAEHEIDGRDHAQSCPEEVEIHRLPHVE